MKKPIIAIVLIAGVAAVYAYRLKGRAPSDNIGFKTAGRLVERTVTEGDPVKNGQVIARVDLTQAMGNVRSVAGVAAAVYAYRVKGRAPSDNIGFKTAGWLIGRTVTEGDPVKKGQVIARVDLAQAMGNVRSVLQ